VALNQAILYFWFVNIFSYAKNKKQPTCGGDRIGWDVRDYCLAPFLGKYPS
jgi:hypothetical protein